MSTRSTTHFIDSTWTDPKDRLTAIIYRHTDGYPEGAGNDIFRFLNRVNKLHDSRFDDAPYLAAKYVVFLAEIFAKSWKPSAATDDCLDFLSVGVMMDDPGDIQYRYIIDCGKIGADGLPEVTCFDTKGNKHDIPRKS